MDLDSKTEALRKKAIEQIVEGMTRQHEVMTALAKEAAILFEDRIKGFNFVAECYVEAGIEAGNSPESMSEIIAKSAELSEEDNKRFDRLEEN